MLQMFSMPSWDLSA